MLRFTVFFWLIACFFPSQLFGQGSVLATGKWIKIGVVKSGMYKITTDELRAVGWENINLQNLQLYGNGGASLPQPNAVPRPTDLQENSVWVEGQNLWFYGESPHVISLSDSGRLTQQRNPYADTTYYFLTVGVSTGKRIFTTNSLSATASPIKIFDDLLWNEVPELNRVRSGRVWYGESFYVASERIFRFDTRGYIPNTPVIFTLGAVSQASVGTSFQLKNGTQIIGNQLFNSVGTGRYDTKGEERISYFRTSLSSNATQDFTLAYNRNGDNAAQAQLRFLGIQLQRELRWRGETLAFRHLNNSISSKVSFQVLDAPAGVRVWEVNGASGVREYAVGNDGVFTFQTENFLKNFVAFTPSSLQKVGSLRAIPNQNIQALSTPNLLIITHSAYKKEAERLADFRRKNDTLSVAVVSTEEIANAVGTSPNDPTALRDFVRFISNKKPNTLRYLLLFGDANYDFTNVARTNEASGYVPAYQSRESLHPIYSFSSDDYFGFLKPTDGQWEESFSGDHLLDIGIGRLPVKTISEAKNIVDKLIRYATPEARGAWRNTLTWIADDGDFNIHLSDIERIANLSTNQPYHSKKIYLDAFPQATTPNGQTATLAREALRERFREGSLITTFAGHGGTDGWTQERLLTLRDLLGQRNANALPLMLTATCEFGRYDDPGVVSGAEITLLNPYGGAIALLTTTRPVFASNNFTVSDAFFRNVFTPINGVMPRLGDVVRITKNQSLAGRLNRNFALLGDPSMRLAYPQNKVTLTYPDTLFAGQRVSLSGTVASIQNGTASVEVYGSPTVIQTLGDENPKTSFKTYNNMIFRAIVPINNARFATSFIVPTDVSPLFEDARIQVYALSSTNNTDASSWAAPKIGGRATVPSTDTQGPDIEAIYEEKPLAGILPSDATLRLKLSDASGISLTNQRPLTLVLNDTLLLRSDISFNQNGTLGEGTVSMRNLLSGNHQLKIKAFDVWGNNTEKTYSFKVEAHTKSILSDVVAKPNPFQSELSFAFSHDFEGDDTELTLEIYTTTGQRIASESFTVFQMPDPFTSMTLETPPIAAGLYIYRIFVRSLLTQQTATATGKVLCLR